MNAMLQVHNATLKNSGAYCQGLGVPALDARWGVLAFPTSSATPISFFGGGYAMPLAKHKKGS